MSLAWYCSGLFAIHRFQRNSFHISSGITALEFAETKPGLLAVRMYNGSIAIYDTSRRNTHDFNRPVLNSSKNFPIIIVRTNSFIIDLLVLLMIYSTKKFTAFP